MKRQVAHGNLTSQYNPPVEFDVAVLSPEKTILTYRLAGLGVRIGAHLFDIVLVTSMVIGSAMVIGMLPPVIDPSTKTGLIFFLSFALPILYFVLFEGLWNGQTIGKKIAGIRVRMSDGTPITFTAALGRNLMRPADMFPGPYFVGMLAMFTNPRAQRIGDLVASTLVCYERRGLPTFTPAPHVAGVHPLEAYVGELRGMTVEEYNALRRFADRFPKLSGHVQERLLQEVWTPIADRRHIPSVPNVHPVYLMEAVVMRYGREHGLL